MDIQVITQSLFLVFASAQISAVKIYIQSQPQSPEPVASSSKPTRSTKVLISRGSGLRECLGGVACESGRSGI